MKTGVDLEEIHRYVPSQIHPKIALANFSSWRKAREVAKAQQNKCRLFFPCNNINIMHQSIWKGNAEGGNGTPFKLTFCVRPKVKRSISLLLIPLHSNPQIYKTSFYAWSCLFLNLTNSSYVLTRGGSQFYCPHH